ncbi:MAG: DUF4136 domain-containing protein [Parasphingopyxis sp.]|nr:DUF4136 domain-containing protein [Sphingomonadales bacterium]
MKHAFARAAALALLGLAAACSTTTPRGTEVTRFHLGEPIAAQAITIEPANEADANSLEFQTYADIVATELARIGFNRASPEEAEMIAVVDVVRDTRIAAARRSPISIGIGGGSYGGGGGVGLGVSTGVGGSRGNEITVTMLDVKLKRRSEGTIVWEGRALRPDQPEDADRAAVVARLASALFQDFPGESGRTITVE